MKLSAFVVGRVYYLSRHPKGRGLLPQDPFVLFVMALVVSATVNFFAARLVQRTGLTRMDRFLGVIFGFLRGAVLVSILVLIAGLTTLPKEPWWGDSFFLFRFEAIAVWVSGFLPGSIAGNFKF